MKNLKLFKSTRTDFGPKELMGQRKEARPYSPYCGILLTIKARENIFDPYDPSILQLVKKYAKRNNIRIFEKAFVWNHAHLLIQTPNKKSYDTFVRSISSALARRHKSKGLFRERPHTRLVHWGKSFEAAKNYIQINQLETFGLERDSARQWLNH